MNEKDYNNSIELVYKGGGFLPANERAEELTETLKVGEVLTFSECTARDLGFHRCYFSLLNTIYDYLPVKFQKSVERRDFYKFVKHLRGDFEVLYEFRDGTKMVEYHSIALGRMSQKRFEEFVRDQLPWIYENVLGQFFQDELYASIIEDIELQFETFLAKL